MQAFKEFEKLRKHDTPKKENKAPVADPKETDIYKLPDK